MSFLRESEEDECIDDGAARLFHCLSVKAVSQGGDVDGEAMYTMGSDGR